MPTDIWKIPLDSNGAVRGSYYLRHHTAVSDTLGVIHFEDGRSVEPVTGPRLVSFIAALGADVDLEPADEEACAAMGCGPVSHDAAAAKALQAAGKSLEAQVFGAGLEGSTVAELAADHSKRGKHHKR